MPITSGANRYWRTKRVQFGCGDSPEHALPTGHDSPTKQSLHAAACRDVTGGPVGELLSGAGDRVGALGRGGSSGVAGSLEAPVVQWVQSAVVVGDADGYGGFLVAGGGEQGVGADDGVDLVVVWAGGE